MKVIRIADRFSRTSSPAASFFEDMRMQAEAALQAESLTETQAWALCEFVDCADSGDIPASAQERESCVNAIANFLHGASPRLFRKFYRGSFSAQGHGVNSTQEAAFG